VFLRLFAFTVVLSVLCALSGDRAQRGTAHRGTGLPDTTIVAGDVSVMSWRLQGGRLDVLNLDGGSSVTLYLRDARGWDYNAGDRLPILIGFH